MYFFNYCYGYPVVNYKVQPTIIWHLNLDNYLYHFTIHNIYLFCCCGKKLKEIFAHILLLSNAPYYTYAFYVFYINVQLWKKVECKRWYLYSAYLPLWLILIPNLYAIFNFPKYLKCIWKA